MASKQTDHARDAITMPFFTPLIFNNDDCTERVITVFKSEGISTMSLCHSPKDAVLETAKRRIWLETIFRRSCDAERRSVLLLPVS
ncbi:hypothetical protein CEXT_621741 [Caerostris extrusa]|uniref:Uncharacterized protein n=1 Tax=Caerostris extrusa TaxID=172846 RepID=A0AAV4RY49_CAEEX|nr:hypothetical protein CEXT_621741 [Caerostris extrusa]